MYRLSAGPESSLIKTARIPANNGLSVSKDAAGQGKDVLINNVSLAQANDELSASHASLSKTDESTVRAR